MSNSGYTLYKREKADGSFVWHYQISQKITGTRRLRESTRTDNEDLAHAIALKRLSQIRDENIYGKKPEITLGEACARYLQEHAIHLKSIVGVLCYTDYFIEYFGENKNLSEIDTNALIGYRNWRLSCNVNVCGKLVERKISINTVHRELSTFCKMHNLATNIWKRNTSDINMSDVKLQKPDKEITFLTSDELDRLFSYLKERQSTGHTNESHLYDIVMLGFYTGLRAANVLNMRREDIDFANDRIRCYVKSKKQGGKLLYVQIHDILREFLIELLARKEIKGNDLLFTYKGQPIKSVRKSFSNACRAVDIQLPRGQKFHILRHSFVMYLLNKGIPAHVVQKMAGHADIKTTMEYVHVLNSTMREAANQAFLAHTCHATKLEEDAKTLEP